MTDPNCHYPRRTHCAPLRLSYRALFWSLLVLLWILPSPAGAVTINPATSPTTNASQVLTGTLDNAASTVTVICPTATVGSVSYSSDNTSWSAQLTGLAEGSNQITVNADQDNTPSATATIVLDTTGPALTVSTLGDGAITNNAILNVSGTAIDPNGVASVTVNGAPITVAGNGAFTTAVTLSTGANVITTVATDTLGNSTTDSRTITLDQTAPVLTVTAPADNSATNQATAMVSGSVDKTATVTVAVGSGSAAGAAMNGTSFSATVSLVSGQNTITIVATDLAGNKSNTVTRTILYDTTIPSVAITTPNQDVTTNVQQYTIQGTAGDAQSTVTVTVSGDGNSYNPPVSGSAFSQQLSFTTNMSYTITATATDQGGNQASASRIIIYDSVPPTVTGVTTTATAGAYNAGRTIPLTVNFSEPVYSTNGLTVTLSSGSGAVLSSGPLTGVNSFTASYVVADGQNTPQLEVTSIDGIISDLAGNQNQSPAVPAGHNISNGSNGVTIVIDTIAPIATITGHPATPTQQRTGSLTFTADDPAATFQCSLDNAPYGSCSSPVPFDFTGQADASHSFSVRAIDAAGNVGVADSVSWTIDTTPPTVTNVTTTATTGAYNAGRTIPLTVTFSEPVYSTNGLTVTLSSGSGAVLSSGPLSGVSFFTASYVVVGGQNTPKLDVTTISGIISDLAGNQNQSPAVQAGHNISNGVTIVIDTIAPIATITGHPATPTQQRTGSLTFTADDPAATFQCSLDSAPYGSCNSPVPFDFTGQADASHSFSVRAIDAAGNVGAAKSVSWTVDTTPPTVTGVTTTAKAGPYKAGLTIPLTVNFSEPVYSTNGLTVTLSTGAVLTSGALSNVTSFTTSYVVVAGQNTPQLDVTAIGGIISDLAGNQNQSPAVPTGQNISNGAAIVIDTTPPVITFIALPPSGSSTPFKTLTVQGQVTDALSGVDKIIVNGNKIQPDSNGNFSTDLTLALGGNNVVISAVDLAGNITIDPTYSRTIIYDPTVPAISISAPASANYKTNQSSLMVTGSVNHDCVITLHVSGPGGIKDLPPVTPVLSGSDSSGTVIYVFSQEIDGLTLGVTTIDITATTAANQKSTTSLTVTYETAAPALTVDSPPGDVRTTVNTLTVSGTVSDPVTQVTVTVCANDVCYTPAVSEGGYSQAVPLPVASFYQLTVTAKNEAGTTTTVKRRVINAVPTGDLNGDGKTDISDALLALQVAVGLKPQLDSYLVYGDVGPWVNGVNGEPAPDWKIDISDVVLILRFIAGSQSITGARSQ